MIILLLLLNNTIKDYIMLIITLDSKQYKAHKDTLSKYLENNIDDLRLYVSYRIIEDDDAGISIDYPHDIYLAGKVHNAVIHYFDNH